MIFRHNGILDKFMGDTVMALFCGFGPAAGDFAARGAADGAEAALLLREVSAEFLRKWAPHAGAGTPFGLACGMHTAESLIGHLGIEIHGQFTAVGPQVGLASQLAKRAEAGRILLSQATAEKLLERYDVTAVAVASDLEKVSGEQTLYQLAGKRT